MNRKLSLLAVFLVLFGMACGSMNRVTPAEIDDTVIEGDVRGKVATAVPGKTFAIEVKVQDAVVTLSGHVDSDEDRRKIGEAAASVNGVKRVINNLHVQ